MQEAGLQYSGAVVTCQTTAYASTCRKTVCSSRHQQPWESVGQAGPLLGIVQGLRGQVLSCPQATMCRNANHHCRVLLIDVRCCALSVLQVVDARDPLTYFSKDLVAFAEDLHPTKHSFVLLNKADLLPEAVRAAWADHFDSQGIQYGFWSAFAAAEAQAKAKHDATAYGLSAASAEDVTKYFYELLGVQQQAAVVSSRTKVLTVEELLERFEELATAAVGAADEDDPRK